MHILFFSSCTGEDGPVVCLDCEYDAISSLGHACGHNLVAIGGLGTALAIRDVMEVCCRMCGGVDRQTDREDNLDALIQIFTTGLCSTWGISN